MGDIYYHELGQSKDEQKARDYYEKAIEHTDLKLIPEDKKKDFSETFNNLGIIYFYQFGLEKKDDFKRARKHFQNAVDFGCFEASETLNYFEANKFGVESQMSSSSSSDDE